MVRSWRSLLQVMSDDIKFAVVVVVHNDNQAFCYKLHGPLVILLVILLYSHNETCVPGLNIASRSPQRCHEQREPTELSVAEKVSVFGSRDKIMTNSYSIVTGIRGILPLQLRNAKKCQNGSSTLSAPK
jgi:hypothetical protein